MGLRLMSCAPAGPRTVHLGSSGNHVLDVVSVTGAVDVGVVAVSRLILHVRCVNGDLALALFGGLVDLVVGAELSTTGLGENL
jgi:hypothetical protein